MLFLIQQYEWITFIKYILWIDNANEPCSFSHYLFQIEELWREGSRHKDGLLQPQSCTDQPWELYLQSPEWRHQRPRDYQVKNNQRQSGQKYSETIRSNMFMISGNFCVQLNWKSKIQCISNSRGEVVVKIFYFQSCAIYLQKYCTTRNVQKHNGEESVP